MGPIQYFWIDIFLYIHKDSKAEEATDITELPCWLHLRQQIQLSNLTY